MTSDLSGHAATIVHERRVCQPCEDGLRSGAEIQLYRFGFDDGHCVSIAHGCEHFIRGCYPDDPPSREWLAEHAAEAVQMVGGELVSYHVLVGDDPALDCAEHGFTYRTGSIGCPECLFGQGAS